MGILSGVSGALEVGRASAQAFASRSSGNLDRVRQLNFERSGGRGTRPLNLRSPGLSESASRNLQSARAQSIGLIDSLAVASDNDILESTQRAIAFGERLSSDQSINSAVGNLVDNAEAAAATNFEIDDFVSNLGSLVDETA